MAWFFVFFLISGLCSLVYEVVWLRLAMAQFGVTSALVATVLSVFMLGLALGSWGAGRLVARVGARRAWWWLRLYAVAELLIGVSGLAVPVGLRSGRDLLRVLGGGVSWASTSYYFSSGLWIGLVLLPFCFCMGATIPLGMAAIRERFPDRAGRSFSFLYLANVVGATLGTLMAAYLLIETLGLMLTLGVTALCNAALALAALTLAERMRRRQPSAVMATAGDVTDDGARLAQVPRAGAIWLLLMTGLTTMAMEVVWTRLYTPFLGTEVYAFANILGWYLTASYAGSTLYRRASRKLTPSQMRTLWTWLWILAAPASLLALVGAGFEWDITASSMRVAIGVMPFCTIVGFLTPMLVDRWSGGSPERAGKAYAVNVVGCIVGPLVAGFALLPLWRASLVLVLLSLPLFVAGTVAGLLRGWLARGATVLALLGSLTIYKTTVDIEARNPTARIERDHTATTIAVGEGLSKQLLVNGYGMTSLTPITKMMAHVPLIALDRPAKDALVICFGMGTTFRSLLSWGIDATAVELVPGVPKLFDYYHADAKAVASQPNAHIVIDDGRRYLERTPTQFDVITIDPPPPLSAAGSSLLYSKEFYQVARRRLKPGGVLQQWIPADGGSVLASVVKSIYESFPHVRAFRSVEGWGYHFLASDQPIKLPAVEAAVAKMPDRAAKDMIEWGPASTADAQLAMMFGSEANVADLMALDPDIVPLDDSHPVNEYYFLRETLNKRGSARSSEVSEVRKFAQ